MAEIVTGLFPQDDTSDLPPPLPLHGLIVRMAGVDRDLLIHYGCIDEGMTVQPGGVRPRLEPAPCAACETMVETDGERPTP